MIKRGIKKGFTLVELLVAVAIITILSGGAYIGIQRAQVRVMNEKVIDDLSAITNALAAYKNDKDNNNQYPLPTLGQDKNVLCFGEDMAYTHDCSASLFMQTQIDNTLLTKRYLQEVPTDPRTQSRYVYGVTTDGKYFQVAGNFEEDDGVWTARTSGNLEEYPFLSGLIRAYNGPNFVVEGEGYLPYSPDHMSITATLSDIMGSITVDDGHSVTTVTPASSEEEKTVKPDSTINTGPASSATLYFSDGSITYLDPNTTLHISPRTEVEKNDEDGIITKIRLKLTSGKIWNKVARLASESEFNVETTAAIAGVRGTEFGINFDATELIVRSGTVVARQFGPGDATGTDFFEFDNTGTFFNANQVIIGDGTFKEFTVPAHNASVPSAGTPVAPPVEQDIREKYYIHTLGLSPADTPYIKKAESHINETYTLYITFNGFESDGSLQIDGFEIFGKSQTTEDIRAMKEGALENPLLNITNVTYSPANKAYLFDIDYKTQPSNHLYNQAESKMELIILRAYYDTTGGKRTYSRLSWPRIGLVPDKIVSSTYEYDNSNVYQEFFGVVKVQPPAVCGNAITEAAEQCDDGNNIEYDKCNNSCQLTNNLLYADYGGTTPSVTADFVEGTMNADGVGTINLSNMGMLLSPNAHIKYSNTSHPNLQKGSMEFVVNGSDLKALPGQEFFLFDMQETSNANDLDKRIMLRRKTFNDIEFNIRELAGTTVIAKTTVSELANLPNGELKVHVIWDVNATYDPDKAILKIYDGNTNILTQNNIVPATNPNLGANIAGKYDFYIGSKIGGIANTQFPGVIRSFMIKSQ